MPTRVSAAADLERELLTAKDFLEWLEPGRTADLIDGEVFMHSHQPVSPVEEAWRRSSPLTGIGSGRAPCPADADVALIGPWRFDMKRYAYLDVIALGQKL